MRMLEEGFVPGIEYYRYIQPEVYNRLVEGYASDEFWNVLSRTSDINQAIEISKVLPELVERIPEIADLLEKKPFVDWYAEVADYVSELVNRADTLKSVADQLVGVVVERFFALVGDLVGVHDNLMWYGDAASVSAAYSLFDRQREIVEVVSDLHGIRGYISELTSDLYPIRDSLKRISASEADLSTLVGDKDNLHWVARADVKGVLESFVTGGVLPTIKENAYFDKNMNVLGTLSLGKPLGLSTVDPLKALADISPDLVELNDLHGIRGDLGTLNTDLYPIRGSLKSLAGIEPDITTLVGDKANLHWIAREDVTGVLEDLVSSGILPTIKENASFDKNMNVLGTLSLGKPLGLSTVDPLKALADISPDLVSLNANLYPIMGNLKALNTYLYDVRGELKTLNADLYGIRGNLKTLNTYLYGIRGNLKDFVSKGLLPEIKEPAKFLKDVNILGKLNLLKGIADGLKDKVPAMRFIQQGYDFKVGVTRVHWTRSDLGSGMTGFKNWVDRINFILDEIKAGHYPVAYALGLPFHLAAGLPFLSQMADLMKKFMEAWS